MLNKTEQATKHKIANLSNVIREKYRDLKVGLNREENILRQQFRPITEPLKELVKIKSREPELMDESYDPLNMGIMKHDDESYVVDEAAEAAFDDPTSKKMIRRFNRRVKLLKSRKLKIDHSTPLPSPPKHELSIINENDGLEEEDPNQSSGYDVFSTPIKQRYNETYIENPSGRQDETYIAEPSIHYYEEPANLEESLLNLDPVESVTFHSFLTEEFQSKMAADHIFEMLSVKKFNADKVFGVKFDPESQKFLIGNTEILIDHGDIVMYIDGKDHQFEGTPGLYRLLTLEEPRQFSKKDESACTA